jgi:hypothetical protein
MYRLYTKIIVIETKSYFSHFSFTQTIFKQIVLTVPVKNIITQNTIKILGALWTFTCEMLTRGNEMSEISLRRRVSFILYYR